MTKNDIVKYQLLELVNELNADLDSTKKIIFNQQDVKKSRMTLSGGNGGMGIYPSSVGSSLGYDVSLGGKSLEKQLTPDMEKLFGRERDGFIQPNSNEDTYDQPYWRTDRFDLVREAAKLYSKTEK